VIGRTRFACLLPVLIVIALRSLSHANPPPPPWSSGVFDAQGLDDILQAIRVPYSKTADVRPVAREVLAKATGCVSTSEPFLIGVAFLTAAHSRAPPDCLSPSS